MGFQRENFSTDMAAFLAKLDVRGDLMCENFGDGGLFDYYLNHDRDHPARMVYMDGRLEAHSLEKFIKMRDLRGVLNYASSAGAAEFPPTIRFVEVRCDSQPKLTALMNATYQLPRDPRKPKAPRRFADRFRLIYIDVAGALFERMGWRPLASGRDNEKVPD